VRYWHGYLSGERCIGFAYGPVDATATSSSLAPVNSRMVYLSGARLPRLSWKKPLSGYKPAALQQKFLRKYPVYTLVICNLNYGVNNSDSDKYFSINGNSISLVKEYSHLGHIVTSDLDDRTDRAH